MAVSDDRRQLFDSALNYLGNQGVFEAKGFPRRGKELRLRLMEGDKLLAEFNIPNPCPGPHPSWTAQSMPMTSTNAGLEITLEKFEVDGARLKTQCVFLVREDGSESAEWLPVAFEVSDATGNHWRPAADPPLKAASGNRVTGCFLGALWQEEDAWKIRVEFKHEGRDLNSNPIRAVEFLTKPEQVRHNSGSH